MLSALQFGLVFLAAIAGGGVNALAGGGTLITFPVLTAVGLPPVAANMTNTVALCPGYLGGTLSQREDLRGQERRLWILLPASVVGGLLGGLLLQVTAAGIFRALVPYLILLATALLALQPRVRAWLDRRAERRGKSPGSDRWAALPVGVATVYGGYFGAGLGVIVLAVLGLAVDDSLTRVNALKQSVSLATNVAAAVFFVFSGQVVWPAALVMFVGSLIGGVLGGRFAGRVRPSLLRQIVVGIGLVVAVVYFVA